MRVGIALFMVIILVALIPVGMQSTFQETGNYTTEVNETFTPDPGNVTTLNESNRNDVIYNDTVEVYNSSNYFVEQPNNYTWFEGNGTIKTNSTGALSTEPTANITYSYFATTAEHLLYLDLISLIPLVMPFLFFLIPVIIILRVI